MSQGQAPAPRARRRATRSDLTQSTQHTMLSSNLHHDPTCAKTATVGYPTKPRPFALSRSTAPLHSSKALESANQSTDAQPSGTSHNPPPSSQYDDVRCQQQPCENTMKVRGARRPSTTSLRLRSLTGVAYLSVQQSPTAMHAPYNIETYTAIVQPKLRRHLLPPRARPSRRSPPWRLNHILPTKSASHHDSPTISCQV